MISKTWPLTLLSKLDFRKMVNIISLSSLQSERYFWNTSFREILFYYFIANSFQTCVTWKQLLQYSLTEIPALLGRPHKIICFAKCPQILLTQAPVLKEILKCLNTYIVFLKLVECLVVIKLMYKHFLIKWFAYLIKRIILVLCIVKQQKESFSKEIIRLGIIFYFYLFFDIFIQVYMSLHHIQVKLPSPLPLAILQVFLSSASVSPSSLPPSPHPL